MAQGCDTSDQQKSVGRVVSACVCWAVHSPKVCCKSSEGSALEPWGHGMEISSWDPLARRGKAMCTLLSCLNICGVNKRFLTITVIWFPQFNCTRMYSLRGCLVSEGSATKALAWPEALYLSAICGARPLSVNFGRVWEKCQPTASWLSEHQRRGEARVPGGVMAWETETKGGTRFLLWGKHSPAHSSHETNPTQLSPPGAGERLPWISGDGRARQRRGWGSCLGWGMKCRMLVAVGGRSRDVSSGREAEVILEWEEAFPRGPHSPPPPAAGLSGYWALGWISCSPSAHRGISEPYLCFLSVCVSACKIFLWSPWSCCLAARQVQSWHCP